MADQEEELLQLAIRQSLMDQEQGGGGQESDQLSLKEALSDRVMMSVGNPDRNS